MNRSPAKMIAMMMMVVVMSFVSLLFVSYTPIIYILSAKVNPNRHPKFDFVKVVVTCCHIRTYVDHRGTPATDSVASKALVFRLQFGVPRRGIVAWYAGCLLSPVACLVQATASGFVKDDGDGDDDDGTHSCLILSRSFVVCFLYWYYTYIIGKSQPHSLVIP